MTTEGTTAVAVRADEHRGLMASAVSPGQIVETIKHVHSLIREAMTEGIDGDYAVIPGTKRKTLLKPGAEKLLLAFGLAGVARAPQVTDLGNGHREVIVETEIKNLRTGETHAVGIGSCSTLEKKYRYRPGPVTFTGKPVPQQYWTDRSQELLGGPGCSTAKNPETGSWEIVTKGSEVENPDPADGWNTVMKMASKRSMIDGVMRATASSAMFTQDMEDAMPANSSAAGNGSTATQRQPLSGSAAKYAKPAPGATNEARGLIAQISVKQGTGKKGAWTKYGVQIGAEWYGTFDTALGEDAETLKTMGSEVIVTWKPDGDYRTLTAIRSADMADNAAPAAAGEREPGQD